MQRINLKDFIKIKTQKILSVKKVDVLLLAILYYALFFSVSFAQYPSINFKQNSLGGSNSEKIDLSAGTGGNPQLSGVVESRDGHYVIILHTQSSDGYVRGQHDLTETNPDFWAIKINGITGDTIWTSSALGGSNEEGIISAFETSEGNYVISGTTKSSDGNIRGHHGGKDFWAVKLNGMTGDTIWTSRALGGSKDDYLISTFESNDGNYVLAGHTNSSDGDIRGQHDGTGINPDFWAVKLNGVTGDTVWTSRALGGISFEAMISAFESSDGNYMLFGSTRSSDGDVRGQHGTGVTYDFWAVKLNGETGDTIWTSRSLGGTGYDNLISVFESNDGNYVLSGTTYSSDGDIRGHHGGTDFWTVKLNSMTGDTIWTSRALGGSGSEQLISAFQGNDGNYILSGHTNSSNGDIREQHGTTDFWIVKLNSITGDTIWTSRALGGSGSEQLIYTFKESNANYVFVGTTNSSDGDVKGYHGVGKTDFWLVKLNGITGDIICISNAIGGKLDEELNQVKPTCNGGWLLSGDTYTMTVDGDVTQNSYNGSTESFWIIKLDSLFNIEWDKVISDSTHSESGKAFLTTDGGFFITGVSSQTAVVGDKTVLGHGSDDFWTIKMYWIKGGFIASDSVCTGNLIFFTDNTEGLSSAISGVTWQWDFGDGKGSSNIQNPQYTYDMPGVYWVTQIVNKECQWDTTIRKITVLGTSLNLGNDTTLCYPNTSYTLDVGNNDANYQWSTGDTGQTLIIDSSGQYSVSVTDTTGCSTSDTIQILFDSLENCQDLFKLFIPNSFSPNGDGINDLWLVKGEGINTIKINVYDRFGKVLYETTNMNSSWDGMNRGGNHLDEGIYIYYFEGVTTKGDKIIKNGNIMLID